MSGANPDQLWNLIPNGPTPLTGQEQLLAAQTASPSAPMYRYPVNALTAAAVLVASSVIATGSTTLRTLQDRFADRYSVLDWLTPGQPDGTTDNSAQLQAAINGAAGVAQLLFPATANFYVAKGLVIPSNSHIIIERGATLWVPSGGNQSMFLLATGATNVFIELYGTLNGNASGQTVSPPTSFSGGIVGGLPGTAGLCTHSAIVGGKSGLITNFSNWPVSLSATTDVEISGISATNSGLTVGGGSGFGGQIQRPNAGTPSIVSGTYTGATGIVNLTTSAPHGIVPGEEFEAVTVTGTGGYPNAQGIFIASSGTTGTTLIYQANAGGTDGTLSGGQFNLWAILAATITSGAVVGSGGAGGAGVATITTAAAHGLTYGQRAIINATSGTAATAATGVFVLLAGTSGTTLIYSVPAGTTAGTVTGGTASVSTKSYDSTVIDCYADNINDFAFALYAGCEGCTITRSKVTRCPGGGIAIYSDQGSGRNINCELSNCNVHNNYSSGIVVATNFTATIHKNCRVFGNYSTGNLRGAALGNVDGLNFYDNTVFANMSSLVTPGAIAAGEINVEAAVSRINIFNNTIRDAGGGGVGASAIAQVTSGTYDNTTGTVVLNTSTNSHIFKGIVFSFSGVTGTGAFASLAGNPIIATDGTISTITFAAAPGLGATTITGGQVWPSVYGLMLSNPVECHVFGNTFGDYQTNMTMVAALGGSWGAQGWSEGNYYGPQINTTGNFPADQSVYQNASVQGRNFDLVTGFISGTTPVHPFPVVANNYPSFGLTMGYNYSSGTPGRGEIDFFVGAAEGGPGGFDFLKVVAVHLVSGTYNSGSGAVSLTTNLAHGVSVGTLFVVSAVTGTGADILKLQGNQIATAGSSGTTLNFTVAAALDILTITNGQINATTTDGGQIDPTVGIAGSLLANDGYGNTRLGGALVFFRQSATLTNGGTATIPANTGFFEVLNSGSIASGTVVLPVSVDSSFPALPAAGNVLEVNFENPVGAVTWTGTVTNAPTAIAAAGTSVSFIANTGSTWLRRVMT